MQTAAAISLLLLSLLRTCSLLLTLAFATGRIQVRPVIDLLCLNYSTLPIPLRHVLLSNIFDDNIGSVEEQELVFFWIGRVARLVELEAGVPVAVHFDRVLE